MFDNTYKILNTMLKNNSMLTEAEIAKYTNTLITTHYLVSCGYIFYGITEDGAPDGLYSITNEGRQYVVDQKEKHRDFIKSFFSQFITGLLTGSIGLLAIEHLIIPVIRLCMLL